MDERRKRALLAGIEGQLAALDRASKDPERHWQRITWALEALAAFPVSNVEAGYLARLQQHVTESRGNAGLPEQEHRLTLLRADCLLWQLHLKRLAAGESHAA